MHYHDNILTWNDRIKRFVSTIALAASWAVIMPTSLIAAQREPNPGEVMTLTIADVDTNFHWRPYGTIVEQSLEDKLANDEESASATAQTRRILASFQLTSSARRLGDLPVCEPAHVLTRARFGGGWSGNPWFCRSACRDFGEPNEWSDEVGFRLELDASSGSR